MSVTHGADAPRLREVAQEISGSGHRLDDVLTSGRSMTQILAEAWSGDDMERFVGDAWPGAEQRLVEAGQLLQAMSDAARRNADDQESASEGGGAPSGGGAPGAGRGSGGGSTSGASDDPGGQADPGQSRDPEEYGDLPAEVREKWESYSEAEKRAIVEQIIKERAEHYGLDMPDINWDDDMSGNGAWLDDWWFSDEVYINPEKLDDPMILHTVFHEMRHGAQHEAVDDASTFWWWEEPEYNHGMTPEEVQEWEDNFGDYQSAPTQEEWDEDPEAAQEKYDRYFEQPVEVDAREEGAEFVEGMTPEELDRLLEESQ